MKDWSKFSLVGFGLVGAGIGLAVWSGAFSVEQRDDTLSSKIKTISFCG
jgi:hypothetical protein